MLARTIRPVPVRPTSPLVSVVLGLAISISAVSVGAAEPPTAEEIRATVDADRLRGDLRALTGHDPIPDGDGGELVARTRNIHHPHHRLAGAWVFGPLPLVWIACEIGPSTTSPLLVMSR